MRVKRAGKQAMWIRNISIFLIAVMVFLMTGQSVARAAETLEYKLTKMQMRYSEGSKTPGVGGGYLYFGEKLGEWMEFDIDVEKESRYEVSVVTKKHDKKGIFQVFLDGEKLGEAVDQKGSNQDNWSVSLGEYEITAGKHTIKIEIVGTSTPSYQIAVSAMNLKSIEDGEPSIPEVDFGESEVSDSGNVTSYPKPYIYEASNDFSVKADKINVPVIAYQGMYDYASFSMKTEEESGNSVTVEIQYKEPIKKYEISPKKLQMTGEVTGDDQNILRLELTKDEYLIIRINGKEKRLVLMADPWETEVPNAEGEGIFNILTEYGADRTGTKLETEKIQKAIDDAHAYGTKNQTRGTVYVPIGVYQVSTLVLKSNVDLYLEGGAVLRETLDSTQYLKRGHKDSIGKPVTHLIHTENNKILDPYKEEFHNPENFIESENMRIYGRGTVDGRGKEIDRLGWLVETLVPQNCQNFSTDGIIYRDSGVWSVNVMWSNDLEFTNFKVLNQMIHEDDCIDINGCQNVIVRNSIGIALDDPYSTKTWEGGELFMSTVGEPEKNENILFDDCLSWTLCYGFKAGQGSFYDHKNVVFQNSTVYDCAVGLGVHHKYGNGTMSDITFENIDIENISYNNDSHSTWIHFQAITGANGKNPIENIAVKNIHVYDRGSSTAKFVGYDKENVIDGVHMEQIYMEELGRNAEDMQDLDIKDLYYYTRNLTLDGKLLPDAPMPIAVQLEDLTEQAELFGFDELGVGDGFVYIGGKIGDWASFPVEVEEAGTYQVELKLKKHSSKGIFQTYIDGQKIGEEYDQYYNGNKTGIVFDLGEVTFEEAGEHEFRFEIVGKNPDSKGYAIVLDAINLTFMKAPVVKMEGIAVEKLPSKVVYEVGEEFDPSGMVVVASYSNATKEEITEYDIEGFDSSTPGKKKITVSASEMSEEGERQFTDSFYVQVVEEPVYVTGIEITRKPDKRVYKQGEELDLSGMVVVASYSNAKKLEVSDYSVDGYDSEVVGEQELTVSYQEIGESGDIEEFTDSFIVEVKERVYISEIYIKKQPKKTTYQRGEELSTDGMVVVASWSNARKQEVTDYKTQGYDPQKIGKQEIEVSYTGEGEFGEEEFETYFTVFVKEKQKPEKPEPEIPDSGDSDDEDVNENTDEDNSSGSDFSKHNQSETGGPSSITLEDWEKMENQWRWRKSDGTYAVSSWEFIQDKWYHFDEIGIMQTGWILDQDTWYYLNEDGSMAENQWIFNGQRWYFVNTGGSMAKEQWVANGNSWYYVNTNGVMEVNHWVTGTDGVWYYMMPDGRMAADTVIFVDGQWYQADAQGCIWR